MQTSDYVTPILCRYSILLFTKWSRRGILIGEFDKSNMKEQVRVTGEEENYEE